MPDQTGIDVYTGKIGPDHGESGHVFVAQVLQQWRRIEGFVAFAQLVELFDLFVGHIQQLLQFCQRVVEIIDLFRNQLQAVGRHVLGQHPALTIVDDAARRRQR